MKILLKLVYLSGLIGLFAATSDNSGRNKHMTLATQVECGNTTWINDQFLGNYNGQAVYIIIHENRIYIRWDGRGDQSKKNDAFDNTAILLHMDNNKFPNNAEGNYIVNHCVNSQDPSTANPQYLTVDANGTIKCNNKTVPETQIGTYIGGDSVKTFLTSRKENAFLRVTFRRETTSPDSPLAYGMGLIKATYAGENHSFVNPAFHFSYLEVIGCFWDELPKYPDRIIETTPNCVNAPVIQTINNVTKTSLLFSFNTTDAKSLKWRIKSGGTEVRSGTSNLNGNSTGLNYNTLSAGNYILEIEGNDCSSGINSKSFSITDEVCVGGPAITSIRNTTSTGLTVDFSGTNIPNLVWTIKNGTQVSASGTTASLNSANSANLTYNSLTNGTYILEIQGGECASTVSSQSFTISTTGPASPCPTGPPLLGITSSSESNLTFSFHGNGVYAIDWKIMQNSENGTVVRENRVSPQSSTPNITFANLPTGIYYLQIQGGSCTSAISTGTQGKFGINVALPIYISSFEGCVVKKGIELSWKVVQEKNGDGFEILRFDDKMKTAETIGKVALTEQGLGEYKFLDENPLNGTNYYQLKQIDKDGSFIKSKIVAVKSDLITEAMISPNPVEDNINVRFSSKISGESRIDVYNMAGIKLSSTQITVKEGLNNHFVNVGKLAEGNYILKVSNGNEVTNLRFMKSR